MIFSPWLTWNSAGANGVYLLMVFGAAGVVLVGLFSLMESLEALFSGLVSKVLGEESVVVESEGDEGESLIPTFNSSTMGVSELAEDCWGKAINRDKVESK